IFSLTFVFLVLMLSSLFCSLTDPKCFLRIKDKENQDGDKELDCFFSIYTKSGHVKNDHFSGNLDKQLTPKNVHLILSLYFAMEEINRNPHILPNISLLVNIKCNLIADQKRSGISAKRSENFPNYYCRNQRKYFIVLTGPMWVLPATLGPFLYMSKTPQVSWMFSLLKNIQFVNPAGDLVNMNQKTKKDTEYDIFYITDFNQHFGLKVKIGKFSGHSPKDQKLCISDEMIEWATDFRQTPPSICSRPCGPGHRKSPQEGKAICCFECNPCPENEISNMTNMDHCLKCPDDQYSNAKQTHCLKKVVTFLAYEDPLGMCLVGLALCFSSLTAAILTILFKYQDTPIVKANNRVLSYVLLISLIFCFLCPLLYIGHPHMATCILQQITFAIVFTVATSSVLAKTITVVLAFKITVPDRRMRWLLASGAPNFIIPMCTVIQLIICGIWMGTSPPFVDEDVHAEHGHILIVCNKGSVIAFYYVLGYLGSLSLASFTVAFLARNLPDTFNEAKFLTFSMLVVCSVWITFIPVYQSTKGKATVAVEIFCILASSAGLLFCIFAPKCYIILFKPQINSFHKFWNIHLKDE
uniref:G-protein coupled receptors family 3 profile domain-containing protein n=1 Tax=Peromyscus maniculatus bairdii TaxID=230844 RepID=A0A8C8UCV5_PERMB